MSKPLKDLDALLKAIAGGLAAMADGIHAMVKKVDNLAKGQAPKKPAKAKPATKKVVPPGHQYGISGPWWSLIWSLIFVKFSPSSTIFLSVCAV
jgi:hypothetical protein